MCCVWQRENKPAWLVQPNPQSFHQNIKPHAFYLHWFLLHLLRLWFQLMIKDLFHTDQYGRWRVRKPGLLYQAFYDLGSYDMLMGFSPHTVCSGRFMPLLWFYTGYVRLCYEKGAMSSCWKYAGFCGYFSFLSRLSFWLFFWDPFCCWITLHSWRNNAGHIASVVWSNNQNDILLFQWWLVELSAPLHCLIIAQKAQNLDICWKGQELITRIRK